MNNNTKAKIILPLKVRSIIESHMKNADTIKEGAKSAVEWLNDNTSFSKDILNVERVYKHWINRRYRGDYVAKKYPLNSTRVKRKPSARIAVEFDSSVPKFAVLHLKTENTAEFHTLSQMKSYIVNKVSTGAILKSYMIVDWNKKSIMSMEEFICNCIAKV